MRFITTLFFSVLAASSIFAAECPNEPNSVDTECLTEQWATGIKRADKELNATYKKLLKSIPDENTKADLVNAQRAWVTFYQLDCQARRELMHIGSSFTKWEVSESCKLEKLKRRIVELKEHCGSDLDCRDR